ncbi:alpha/beta fold hydrolase [Candidatus Uhrbacteria bacterium]|nr:alpha/beta fold hydrolase [Candidatus Uhrbacteria bacterium]
MAQRVLIVHGGNSFDEYSAYLEYLRTRTIDLNRMKAGLGWKDHLQRDLGDDFDVIQLSMPDRDNAKYLEWSIWFNRVLNLSDDPVILIGHSLGAVFLAKYLSEEEVSVPIVSTVLVAPPYGHDSRGGELIEFELSESLSQLSEQGGAIHLFHSEDDPVISFNELAKYRAALPDAVVHIFKDRGHFNAAQFPQIFRR